MLRGDRGADEVIGLVGAEVHHSFVESMRVHGDSPDGPVDALLPFRLSFVSSRGTPGFRFCRKRDTLIQRPSVSRN